MEFILSIDVLVVGCEVRRGEGGELHGWIMSFSLWSTPQDGFFSMLHGNPRAAHIKINRCVRARTHGDQNLLGLFFRALNCFVGKNSGR